MISKFFVLFLIIRTIVLYSMTLMSLLINCTLLILKLTRIKLASSASAKLRTSLLIITFGVLLSPVLILLGILAFWSLLIFPGQPILLPKCPRPPKFLLGIGRSYL